MSDEWSKKVQVVEQNLSKYNAVQLEQKRAKKLGLSQNRYIQQLQSIKLDTKALLEDLEKQLTKEENVESVNKRGAMELKQMEQDLLNLDNKFGRIESESIPQNSEYERKQLLKKPNTKSQTSDNILINTETENIELKEQSLNEREHMQLQERIMQSQDTQLESLSLTIQRQTELGRLINGELEHHIEILDDIDERVERTGAGLRGNERLLDRFQSEQGHTAKGTCMLVSLLIFLLVIVILAKR
ncbi:hypothetical protein HK099_002832 [Clydaea vesicula]|uniref:t-SNARE coiled-coil homology domain-containing protein n=1 Tax=Clydaea vesicula TaxID=447962 RepID=A0AAD5U421_9FUNG|nr:hypothetical protein HK099_002832 [Clydaea vesicula]KAJ3381115.1 hypothetical protein HDU92_005582 [Lobulomyces angularis]